MLSRKNLLDSCLITLFILGIVHTPLTVFFSIPTKNSPVPVFLNDGTFYNATPNKRGNFASSSIPRVPRTKVQEIVEEQPFYCPGDTIHIRNRFNLPSPLNAYAIVQQRIGIYLFDSTKQLSNNSDHQVSVIFPDSDVTNGTYSGAVALSNDPTHGWLNTSFKIPDLTTLGDINIELGDNVTIYQYFGGNATGDLETIEISFTDTFALGIFPLADSYGDEANPSSNYGNLAYMWVNNQTSAKKLSFMKFNLTFVTIVDQASLHVNISSVSQSHNVTIHNASSSSWDEYTLTWANRPTFDSTILDWQLATTSTQWLVFNLTALVQSMKGRMMSVVLQSSGLDNLVLRSKEESQASLRPFLDIIIPDTRPPKINITNPANKTYPEPDISLTFTIDEESSWIGYSLDGAPNVTITGDTLLSSLTEAPHSIIVYANDTTGNMGNSSTIYFSVDLTFPIISIINPINITYSTNTVWLNFTIDETTSWIGCSLDGNDNITILGNITLGSLADGSHHVSIYANDTAGNMGVPATVWFTIDIIPPIITVNSPINSSYPMNSVWLNFTLNEPITWIGYSLDGASNVTITEDTLLSSLSEETHYVTMYTNDSVGNMGVSATIWFTVDTSSPNIVTISPTNLTYTENTVQLNFTIDETTSWIGYSLDGNDNITIFGNTSLSLLTDGSHNVIIYINDTAGNIGVSGTVWFTVDTIVPYIEVTSPSNTTYVNQSAWLNFTVNETTSWIGYSLDNAPNVTITENILLSPLSDGFHNIVLFANDSVGNMGNSLTIWFGIDTVLPIITMTSPTNSTYTDNSIWLNFSINEPTSWIGFSLDESPNETISSSTLLSPLLDGFHQIIMYSNDTAGNMAKAVILWFMIDTTLSNITIISPINGTYTSLNIWLNFTIDEPTSWIGYSLDKATNVTIIENTLLNPLSDGSHSMTIYSNDRAGNMAASTTTWFTVKIPPVLEVSGLNSHSTYSGNLVVSVTITDNSALSSVKTWITNGVDMISYISQSNLTLINVTDEKWTFIVIFDTNILSNGEYEVWIQVNDVYSNEATCYYLINIHNQYSQTTTTITTSTTIITTTEPTTTTESTTTTSVSLGLFLFSSVLSIIIVVLHRKESIDR